LKLQTKIFNNDETLVQSSAQIFSKALFMNKTELIEHIAKQADISKAAAGRALEATIGAVRTTLKKGGTVALVGFGTFAVTKRAARTGRNPRTGAAIKIKSAKVPKFRPGKALKDALN
jgi:DNA-binding protein HU-beta